MVRTLVAWGLFPSMLVSGLYGMWRGLEAGLPVAPLAMSIVLTSAVILLIAQRYLPAEPEWAARPRRISIDLLHMLSTGLATEGVRALAMGVVLQVAVALHDGLGSSLWPTFLPLPLQVMLGVLVGDFGADWVHGTCHRFRLLWRVHAMHHSSEQMYVFAAARNHPANAVLMNCAHLMPLTLLGAPVEVVALTTVFTGLLGMLQHCNV